MRYASISRLPSGHILFMIRRWAPQSVGGATNTLKIGCLSYTPLPPTVSIVRGHGYTTITLFLVHDVIMACVRSRYEHLDITEPSCGKNNDVNRGSNTDKESKHTISAYSLFLFVIGRISVTWHNTFITIGRSVRITEQMAPRQSK